MPETPVISRPETRITSELDDTKSRHYIKVHLTHLPSTQERFLLAPRSLAMIRNATPSPFDLWPGLSSTLVTRLYWGAARRGQIVLFAALSPSDAPRRSAPLSRSLLYPLLLFSLCYFGTTALTSDLSRPRLVQLLLTVAGVERGPSRRSLLLLRTFTLFTQPDRPLAPSLWYLTDRHSATALWVPCP